MSCGHDTELVRIRPDCSYETQLKYERGYAYDTPPTDDYHYPAGGTPTYRARRPTADDTMAIELSFSR